MKLTLIAAIGKNRELGKNNDMIWHLPQDLKFFRQETSGHTIVMGRKTFESLPGKLPKRHHVVISRTCKDLGEDIEMCESVEEFMKLYKDAFPRQPARQRWYSPPPSRSRCAYGCRAALPARPHADPKRSAASRSAGCRHWCRTD